MGGEEKTGTHQRKTVELSWDSSQVGEPEDYVRIRIDEGEGGEEKWVTVRRVQNDGAATITFPQHFTGERKAKVQGPDGSVDVPVSVK